MQKPGQRSFRSLQRKVSLALLAGVWGLSGFLLSSGSSSAGAWASASADASAKTSATSGSDASAGCQASGTPPPAGSAAIPFEAAGESGSYLLAAPPAGTPGHPIPLVVDLHGYLESAQVQEAITGLGAYGSTHGFITVTPQVDQTVPHWTYSPGSADRAFIVGVIDHIEATECVNLKRVYMAGYSNGAFMTSSMVCELGGRLAAVATIAGIQAPAKCNPSRPVPVIAFHGTADPLVPYEGGVAPAAKKLPAPDGKGTMGSLLGTRAAAGIAPLTAPIPTELARWASRNHCSAHPTTSEAAAGVTLIAYRCPNDASVELYRENGDGHIWAGSSFMTGISSVVGPTTFAINDDQLIWAFFQAHPVQQ